VTDEEPKAKWHYPSDSEMHESEQRLLNEKAAKYEKARVEIEKRLELNRDQLEEPTFQPAPQRPLHRIGRTVKRAVAPMASEMKRAVAPPIERTVTDVKSEARRIQAKISNRPEAKAVREAAKQVRGAAQEIRLVTPKPVRKFAIKSLETAKQGIKQQAKAFAPAFLGFGPSRPIESTITTKDQYGRLVVTKVSRQRVRGFRGNKIVTTLTQQVEGEKKPRPPIVTSHFENGTQTREFWGGMRQVGSEFGPSQLPNTTPRLAPNYAQRGLGPYRASREVYRQNARSMPMPPIPRTMPAGNIQAARLVRNRPFISPSAHANIFFPYYRPRRPQQRPTASAYSGMMRLAFGSPLLFGRPKKPVAKRRQKR